jgi:anti-sigma regulatory factor (Ser/Thr protein kinase)
MPADLTLDLSATLSELQKCLDTLGESCRRWNLPHETISRLRIVTEELFSNTIKYGYGGECARPVRLRVSATPHVELAYEDQAPRFDPTAWRGAVGTEPDAGGRGIALVLGLAQSVQYERLPGGNRVTLRFR